MPDRRGRRALAGFVAMLLFSLLASTALAAAARPGRIERVRYEADGSSTRVIIMLSRPVPFEVHVYAGEASRKTARRVVLDFSNATLGPGASTPIGVENGLLQQIRTGQFTARTARVVLDLASISKHSIDAYEDPPRVVIDISGTPTDAPPFIAAPSRDAQESKPSDLAAVAPPVLLEERRPPSAAPPAKPVEPAPLPERAAPAVAPTPPPPPTRRVEAPTTVASPKRAESELASKAEPIPGRPANRPWRIVLDPGHGGADPGAQGVNGILEKDVVLAIAQRLKRRLEESSNAKVLLTRETDATRTLAERTAFANANSADLFVSIHANADRSGELQGIETYTLNNSNDRATIRLA
ncbi:MAG: N-acetylmuramoyl-L-alanine amidase, partial [Candidatus Binatia bacterium]